MTVSTVVASLLPIMWSHSTGAEVMKPLATPVLGGHGQLTRLVLIVTPVIFSWLASRLSVARTETHAASPQPRTTAGDGPGELTTRRRMT